MKTVLTSLPTHDDEIQALRVIGILFLKLSGEEQEITIKRGWYKPLESFKITNDESTKLVKVTM